MKKLILTCALVTGAALAASAQNAPSAPPPPPPQHPNSNVAGPKGPMTEEQRQQHMAESQARLMEKQYALTPLQYSGVYKACLEFTKSMDEMRGPGKMPKPVDHEKLEMEKDAKLQKIMTKDQFEKYSLTKRRPMQQQPGMAPQGAPVKN